MNQFSSGKGRWPWAIAGAGVVLVAAAIAVVFWLPGPEKEEPPPSEPLTSSGDIKKQVHQFCGHCHAYPPPDSFPRFAWREEVQQGYRFFALANEPMEVVPPIEDVVKYYEERAPRKLPPAKIVRSTSPLPVKFTRTTYPVPEGGSPPAISNVNLVHLFDQKRLDILACEMRHGLVMALRPYVAEPRWQILGKVPNPAHAEVVDLDGDGIPDILVANLGSFLPVDRRDGSVVWLRGNKDGTFTPITLLKGVGRVADVQAADFNGDGKLDLVVAVFGWRTTGSIIYLENQTTDWNHPKFVRHDIDDRHGTIHVPVIPRGLNGSGKPDFVALISQEHETIVAFLNDGRGHFTPKTIYTGPHPAYGSSGIQLVDLDGDGRLDVLYTNGDVLDKPYLLKPYHSVQWLRNRGRFPFEHHPLTPMYGVHRAVAADLTGTGKKDVVAVGFLPAEGFPERQSRHLDAVILLQQTRPGHFERHALETGTCDHVTCAAGDIFGTGRTDLVVGQYCSNPCAYAITVWKNEGPARKK
jgi:hypothetical protein